MGRYTGKQYSKTLLTKRYIIKILMNLNLGMAMSFITIMIIMRHKEEHCIKRDTHDG